MEQGDLSVEIVATTHLTQRGPSRYGLEEGSDNGGSDSRRAATTTPRREVAAA